MPIPQEVLKAKHKNEIKDVVDQTSRFSFKFECSCGVQGLFYTLEQAQKYRHYHLGNQGISDAESKP